MPPSVKGAVDSHEDATIRLIRGIAEPPPTEPAREGPRASPTAPSCRGGQW